MDSCHLFNFLFGTKKATAELSRCFSSIHERARQRAQADKQAPEEGPSGRAPPPSPLKQIQMKIASLAPTSSNRSGNNDNARARRSVSCDNSHRKSGTFHATLIESLPYDEEDDLDENNNNERSTNIQFDGSEQSQTQDAKQTLEDKGPIAPSSQQDERDAESTASKKVSFDDANLNPVASPDATTVDDNKKLIRPIKYQQVVMYDYDSEQTSRVSQVTTGGRSLSDKRNDYVRNLVQSIERSAGSGLGNGCPSMNDGDDDDDGAPIANIRRLSPAKVSDDTGSRRPIAQLSSYSKPVTLVKPLPPKTPPKTNKAKYLNLQLTMNKPIKIDQLFKDEQFLTRFFHHLEPLDRCSAAQVCKIWRNILYGNPAYWPELMPMIDYSQLRREQLVDCIISTLQSAKIKQRALQDARDCPHRKAPPESGQDWTLAYQCNGKDEAQSSRADAETVECKRCSVDSLFDIDQDEVWRIQELCNKYTHQRSKQASDVNGQGSANGTMVVANTMEQSQVACMASKSSSIPSQISSTLSSLSMSSLISPNLSESSRVETVKERLYSSIDERAFKAIHLSGASDEDIEDLTSKMPPGAHRRITMARLNNGSFTNRGLELFLATFSSIQEIEISHCFAITNAIDLKSLVDLKSLSIDNCLYIADGFAQRIIQILDQLQNLSVHSYHITDSFLDFISLHADTSRLKRLELANCKEITNHTMATIARHFPNLEALSISGSIQISDEGVEVLAEQAIQLKSLDLSWCPKITDAALECIASDLCASLTDLILDRTVHITDAGLNYLSTMSNLELLYIRWCSRVSDAGVESILGMKSLKYLSLAGLDQITARSLLCLIDTNLVEVELRNCPAVNDNLKSFLPTRCPGCNIIF